LNEKDIDELMDNVQLQIQDLEGEFELEEMVTLAQRQAGDNDNIG